MDTTIVRLVCNTSRKGLLEDMYFTIDAHNSVEVQPYEFSGSKEVGIEWIQS